MRGFERTDIAAEDRAAIPGGNSATPFSIDSRKTIQSEWPCALNLDALQTDRNPLPATNA